MESASDTDMGQLTTLIQEIWGIMTMKRSLKIRELKNQLG